MFDKKLYGTSTVGTKGQIVIPAEAREQLGIVAGDKLYVVGSPSHHTIHLIGEAQMQHLVNAVTDNAEMIKSLQNNKNE
ncbi:MAG TPA: AbrB/MazE/SpoVT family DNA-binding domain-containing protein [Candidatus Saccharimonadales bacterium]|jgi:AbrB family looped-hinge helix DNA binding protein